MRYAFLLFLATADSVRNYVLSEGKDTKVTTVLLEARNSDSKLDYEKQVSADKRGIYLEDVLYALNNQNWTVEEQPCLNQTLRMLKNLQNFTLWAVWQWDSISSEPQALLYGNRYHLGNFDQCIEAPWSGSHPDLRNQYCLADIVLERSDKVSRKRLSEPNNPYQSALDRLEHRSYFLRPLNYITWGLCVPNSCQPRSVQRLLGILLAHSHLGAAGLRARIAVNEPCQGADHQRQYDAFFYSFIVFMAISIGTVLICTYIRLKRKTSAAYSFNDAFLKALCIKNNWNDIKKMNKNGLEAMYGLRFLSICFITLDHQLGISNGGPTSNGAQVDKAAVSLLGMFILHNDLFVDTFFVLSGFLSAKALSSFKRLPHPLAIILKRYVRLVVAFAVVIYYVCAVYPLTGSGPLWGRAIAGDTEQCRKNWWLSLLMLSNYLDTENICIVVTWYIPCDFHFFAVTMLLYWLYRRLPRIGVICAILVCIAAIITPGVINYLYQLPPIQLFTYDFITNPRRPLQFHLTYIKSHTRYAAYLIGFIAGLLYSHHKAKGTRISQKYSVLGACLGLVVMLTLLLYGATFLWRSYGVVGDVVYAAIDRPIWAVSVAFLIICCSLGHVPLLKSFLSWYPWAPLSRLSYGLYLTHSIIIARNIYSTRVSRYSDISNNFIQAAGVIVCGCAASLIILLVFELPLNNLLSLGLRQKQRNSKIEADQGEATSYKVDTEVNRRRYMQENLPSPENMISKF
ncbi:unnamed protein product, partial [Iphiclides podalirius]